MTFLDALKAVALLVGLVAIILPGIKIFGLAIAADLPGIIYWLALSAVMSALAGAVLRPKRWWRLGILWPLIITGGLIGHGLYIYVRSHFIPLDFFFRIELAIGFLAGAIPGLFLSKYWK